MHFRLMDFLADPHDREPLTLHTFEGQDGLTRDGVLQNPNTGRWYVVQDGIPTLFIDALRPDDSTFRRRYSAQLKALGCAAGTDDAPAHQDADTVRIDSERRARDEQAEDYDRMWSMKLLGLVEVPAYKAALSEETTSPLLEAGAGTGRLTAIFAEIAPEVVAVDMSRESLLRNRVRHLGRTRHPVMWVHADLTNLPLKDNAFGRCAHAGVYEHIPSRELRVQFLAHAARTLTPNGILMLSAYRSGGLMRLCAKEGEHAGGIPFFRFTPEELQGEVNEFFTVKRFVENLGVYMSMVVATARK